MKKPYREDFPVDYEKYRTKAMRDRRSAIIQICFFGWLSSYFWVSMDGSNNAILFVVLCLGLMSLGSALIQFKNTFNWKYNAQYEASCQYQDAENQYKRYIQQIEEEHDLETARMIRRKRALNEIDNESAINAYAQLSMIQNSQNKQLFELIQETIKFAQRNDYKKLDTGLDQIEQLLSSGGK